MRLFNLLVIEMKRVKKLKPVKVEYTLSKNQKDTIWHDEKESQDEIGIKVAHNLYFRNV